MIRQGFLAGIAAGWLGVASAQNAPPPASPVHPNQAIQQDIPSALSGTFSTQGSGRAIANKTFKNGSQRPNTIIPFSIAIPQQ
jgi:hypothetical protein